MSVLIQRLKLWHNNNETNQQELITGEKIAFYVWHVPSIFHFQYIRVLFIFISSLSELKCHISKGINAIFWLRRWVWNCQRYNLLKHKEFTWMRSANQQGTERSNCLEEMHSFCWWKSKIVKFSKAQMMALIWLFKTRPIVGEKFSNTFILLCCFVHDWFSYYQRLCSLVSL